MIPMEKISRIRNTGKAERVQHYGMVRIGLNEKINRYFCYGLCACNVVKPLIDGIKLPYPVRNKAR